MKIKFCGAASGVTGSCHLITTQNHKLLLDCGQFQGNKAMDIMNFEEFPFDPFEVEYVVLSHAHIDHCGRIPLLVKRGFKGEIICTDATADLLDPMRYFRNIDNIPQSRIPYGGLIYYGADSNRDHRSAHGVYRRTAAVSRKIRTLAQTRRKYPQTHKTKKT